ncbi:AAWKG family protein [Streptomyces sp. KMM 9044]|uniref:AAWKG family protein n=1 Tax=Streptomyces sp. KMM 9044 TaxID=2744474 RepID=UPI002151E345|nr:AAWKG family protein [Streptomyces sp. KMM 9044]WAX77829.1 AAWKG family protein [Streptomyces sp. KMM 9044]
MANPEDNNNDNWKKAVDMLTGYILPERSTLFENLKGNDDIPLIHVRLDREGGPGYSSGFLSPSGWKTKNTDYTLPFYRPSSDTEDVSEGSNLYRYRAYITFLGSGQAWPPSGDDIIPGYTKTSEVLKDKGGWNKEGEKLDWDTNPLVQYLYGSRDALSQLTMWPYSTHGYTNRDLKVDDANYVDLRSFTEAAKAFDRVVKFFEDSQVTVGTWDTEDIGEGSESWDGTSAAIFKELIHKLARNYEGYADQLNGDGGEGSALTIDGVTVTSEPARALAEAQQIILTQAQNLYDAWEAWKAESNPQRWLYDMLEDARLTLFDTQYDKTDIETVSYGSGLYTSWHNNVVATAGFQNDIVIEGKSYGRPSEMSTWKAIGDEAVRRWEQSVQDWLSTAGATAIVEIHKAFKTAQDAFDASVTDRDSRPLSEISAEAESDAEKKKAKEEADAAKAQADKEKAEAKAERDAEKAALEKEKEEAKAEAEQEKAAAKAERDAEKAALEKEKEEAKAEAEQEKAAAKAEQEAAKAEADKEKAQAKAEAEQEKAAAKAEQEAAKAEADKEKAQAKAEAEQEKAAAKAEQEAAKDEADKEKAQAKAEAAEQQAFVLAQNQKAQDEAKKERERAQAQNDADRAEAKAEQEAAKAEAAAEKEAAKQEQAQAKAEAEKEQEAAKAQAEQEKAAARAEQEAARSEYEQDRETARQEQADARADAEAQQEQARREAVVEKQQARLEAEQAKAEAQADYEEQKAEARAEREAAVREADRQEEAARQEYEREKAAAGEQRDQAREQAEQERAQARQEYEREMAAGADEARARQEYDDRIAEIDAAEREAVERADAAEADARSEYEREKAAAQEERDQARTDAEQARKDARAEYDERMGDIQAEYDRINADDKNIDELIRQRIADLPEPPDLSAYNSGGTPAGSAGSAYSSVFADNLYNQDDLSSALGRPQSGDSLAAASADGTGTGAGSPGMYPPMARGAGGEAGGNSGERVRNVIEPGVARSARVAAGTPTVDDEEHRVVSKGTQTSSSMPFMPPMGGMGGAGEGRPQTESGDRERTTWLAEDEDIWGTDEGGAPQALGR